MFLSTPESTATPIGPRGTAKRQGNPDPEGDPQCLRQRNMLCLQPLYSIYIYICEANQRKQESNQHRNTSPPVKTLESMSYSKHLMFQTRETRTRTSFSGNQNKDLVLPVGLAFVSETNEDGFPFKRDIQIPPEEFPAVPIRP